MADTHQALAVRLQERFGDRLRSCTVDRDEVTIEVARADARSVCLALRDDDDFSFEELIDLCGMDYLAYGVSEWETRRATATGFSRGVERPHQPNEPTSVLARGRFAAVYHLLSTKHNRRLRVRVFAEGEPPAVDSVLEIWASANWYEREAFDLYGIMFVGHPDLRRILTDYGFIGHPFRKDFPLIGQVEMRYDPERQRVVYEPVSIEPRVLVPRVIRSDEPAGSVEGGA